MKARIYNFLAMLKNKSSLNDEGIEELEEQFRQGLSGTTVISVDGKSYYLNYESVNFEDWTVLSMFPVDVVNASMNSLQSSTLLLVTGISVSLGILLILYIIQQNRQKLKKKDREILFRDELFTKLSVNVDDIFLMLDADTFRVEYLSPNIDKLVGVPMEVARENIRAIDHLVKDEDTVLILDQLSGILPGQQGEWDRE